LKINRIQDKIEKLMKNVLGRKEEAIETKTKYLFAFG
jgi:hypothetical protein